MTKPPKTMEEIKNAEAEKYSGVEATDSDVALWSELSKAFKAGFDCRDKLGDEALKIAVEALKLVQDKTETDPAGEVELRARAQFVYYRVSDALAEIRKIRGENE